MKAELNDIILKSDTVAVACSGGEDSMALLHFLKAQSENFGFKVIALNVEHGIRGEESVKDSNFVKEYCNKNDIPLLFYQVDCLKKAEEEKLSVEEAGRILRYQCFYDAIEKNKCTKIATAHHLKDNAESVLFNLFRGTGINGISGINKNYSDKIIRPFLGVSKKEIKEYVETNKIPFVVDKTNSDEDYTRNFIRLNILPQIEKIFPNAEESIYRFSCISNLENDFLEKETQKYLTLSEKFVTISLPIDRALLNRAVIKGLKHLGVKKDWEKVHTDSVFNLLGAENGSFVCLPKSIIAVKEYDNIVLFIDEKKEEPPIKYFLGERVFSDCTVKIENVSSCDLKDGLFGDGNKIPGSCVIRTRQDGDVFTKFGGGTKSLGDFLTDKKIPVRLRDKLPLLADGNKILVIFGVAISDLIKIDANTTSIIKFTKE